jgi:hypothetical protein
MDHHLTDLDALILKVRNQRAREYISEAVSAYRAGAYKAAVTSTWVAVSFDILTKIREIAQAGDAAAAAFVQTFDGAVSSNNLKQLMKLENDLLEKSFNPFGFIGLQELTQLNRLKDDRNHCAHPSFYSETELFQPAPDLVRTHIVHSVNMMLANRPMQGKAIIASFASDLASPAFPPDREQTVDYLRSKYLSQMRPGVIVNFATVLLKAFLHRDVPEWIGRDHLVLNSLHAVARADPVAWRVAIRPVAMRLIENLDGSVLPNAFPLLRDFPDFQENMSDEVRIRLTSVIQNFDPAQDPSNAIFAAAGLEGFSEPLHKALGRVDSSRKMAVIQQYPDRWFIPIAFDILRSSGSFRGAENRFQSVITPMTGVLDASNIPELLTIIQDNGQIYDAANIPGLLALVADGLGVRGQLNGPSRWVEFRDFVRERSLVQRYDLLWTVLDARRVLKKD